MIENVATGTSAFTSNAFLVTGERSVLVDTGANFDVVAAVGERTDVIDAVVLTHTHPDHIGNVASVRDAFEVPVFGFDADHDAVDAAIEDEGTVRLGDHEYVAVHTPGHKADHLCFYAADPGVLFTGDLVFAGGSFGRTDLEGGDRGVLIQSIDRVLELVDPDLDVFHAGHGPSVTDRPYEGLRQARQFAATA